MDFRTKKIAFQKEPHPEKELTRENGELNKEGEYGFVTFNQIFIVVFLS